jgi:CRP-like cAMP-binding protein
LAALETRTEAYRKGADLVRPGDRNTRPFIIQSGYVIVSRQNSAGQRMIIELMIPGDIGNARAIVLPKADSFTPRSTTSSYRRFRSRCIAN